MQSNTENAGGLKTAEGVVESRSDALARVRRQSRIAVDDAQVIEERGGVDHEIRLDQNLYVTRLVEREIHERLIKENYEGVAASVLVVGEAGYGKTSLLWRLHSTLGEKAGWEPWFIKSTLLSLDDAGSRTALLERRAPLHANEIISAAEAARSVGEEPIVLLDTVDVLLHGNEDERARLLEFLQIVKEIGCRVVATCRPQEASLLGSFKRSSVALGQYQDGELAEAIEKHVNRFYEHADLRTVAEHQRRIEELVARGLPLRDVCVNPLTLRMLFLLYAPNQVSPEINVFDLYKKYWDDRVKSDVRAGTPKPGTDSVNLENAARLSGLIMLAEGKPEVAKEKLLDGVEKLGGAPGDLELLTARGVLRDQGTETVAFFHQTFFEHSAARGILHYFGSDGLPLLKRRLQERPNDLFLSPIYEQALLLSECKIGADARQGDAFLMELIETDSLIARNSALYVYAHRREVIPEIRDAVKKVLSTSDKVLIQRFLAVAPNISDARLPNIFDEVEIIWGRGKWEERSHVLDFLEGLATRDHKRVQAFLEQYAVLEYVTEQPANFQGGQRLLRIYIAIAKKDAQWSWARVVELYNRAVGLQSRDLQFTIINALCDFAVLFGAEHIASDFDRAAAHAQQENENLLDEEISGAQGRLWAAQWQAAEASVSSVLAEMSQACSQLDLRNRMHGLAELLLNSDEGSAATALVYLENEQDRFRRWLWASIILPRLLRGNVKGANVETKTGSPITPAVRYVREWAKRILAVWLAGETIHTRGMRHEPSHVVEHDLPVVVRRAVQEAVLPAQILLEVLEIDYLNEPYPWLDEQLLGPLLVDAYLAGHEGAGKAMVLLTENPNSYTRKLTRAVISRLGALAAEYPRAREAHLALAVKIRDPDSAPSLVRTMELLSAPVPEILPEQRDEINRFREELLRSKSGNDRRAGVALWINLVRLEMSLPPALETLLERFSQEDDHPTRALLATLIAESALKRQYELGAAVEALLAMAQHPKSSDLRDKALAAVVTIIINSPDGPVAFAMRALEVAITPPTDAGRLSLFGRVIERLTRDDISLAVQLIETMTSASVISDLGTQAKKNVIGRLRSPLRALVRAASDETRRSLLEFVPSLDPVFQRLIVEAICHDAFATMSSQLDEIYAKVSESTQELIRRHKYQRERTRGSGEWLELYALLERQAASANYQKSGNRHGNIDFDRPLRGTTMRDNEIQLRGRELEENNRLLVLRSLYDLSQGDSVVPRRYEELQSAAGLNEIEFDRALRYLHEEGLLEKRNLAVRITHEGVKEIEKLSRQPEAGTEHFTPHIVQNFYAPVGAVQNAPHSTAEVKQKIQLEAVKTRVHDLSDNIAKDFALLKEYEDELRLEDDPRRRARYQREIERLKTSASNYQQEYEKLERELAVETPSESQSVRVELHKVNEKLDALLTGQTNITENLYQLRQAILSRYDAGEQHIINSITERLNDAQAQTVQVMLEAIERDQINEAEMSEAVDAVRRALAEIQQRGIALPNHSELSETVSAPQLDVKHKLKVAIPIIPLLLEYETEIELGSGLNLEGVWNRLVNKFRRK